MTPVSAKARMARAVSSPSRSTRLEVEPLEVGRRPGCPWPGSGSAATSPARIAAGLDGAGDDVVGVGGHDDPLDRQAHALGDVAGEGVAEIAGGHGEGDRPLRARRAPRRR